MWTEHWRVMTTVKLVDAKVSCSALCCWTCYMKGKIGITLHFNLFFFFFLIIFNWADTFITEKCIERSATANANMVKHHEIWHENHWDFGRKNEYFHNSARSKVNTPSITDLHLRITALLTRYCLYIRAEVKKNIYKALQRRPFMSQ